MAKSRSYKLLCPIARALDRIGDRWTLLILRDLHAGPARFSELQRGLTGGTCADDHEVERVAGLVRHRVPPWSVVSVHLGIKRSAERAHDGVAAKHPHKEYSKLIR